jgi:succinylarginine dihydrolase
VVSALNNYLCGRLKRISEKRVAVNASLFLFKKLLNMIQMQLEELIRHKLEEADWADCFLIEVTISPLKAVEVIIDADEGVNFDQCKKLSRFIEKLARWRG